MTKEYNQFWECEVPYERHEKHSKLYQTRLRDPWEMSGFNFWDLNDLYYVNCSPLEQKE